MAGKAFIYAVVLICLGRALDFFPELAFLHLGKVVLGGALLFVCLTTRSEVWRGLWRNPITPWIVVILAAAVLGLPFSVWRGGAFESLINYLKELCTFFILCALVGNKHGDTLCRAVVVTVGMLAILMVVSAGTGRHHVSSTYDPNDIALFFVTFLPLTIAEALSAAGVFRYAAWGMAGLSIAGIALTGSRGGVLALGAVALHFLFLAKKRRPAVFVLLCLGAAVVLGVADDSLWERFRAIGDETDYNFEARDGRLEIWKEGLHLFTQHPLTGVGIGQFSAALGMIGSGAFKTAHNSYIQIAAELGLAGIAAYLAAFWRVRRMAKDLLASSRSEAKCLRGCALQLGLTGFMAGSFFLSQAYSAILYCLLALAVGLWLGRQQQATAAAPAGQVGEILPVRDKEAAGSAVQKAGSPAVNADATRKRRLALLRQGDAAADNGGGQRP